MSIPGRGGCPMGDGLYLKANGELPCWCHIGETEVLDQIDTAWLQHPDNDLLGHPQLKALRLALRQGELPYPDLCGSCPALGEGDVPDVRPRHFDRLLVEPSYLCALDCPACISPKHRLSLKGAPYYLEPDFYSAFLERLKQDGVESIRQVHLEGRGDPMLSRHTGTLIRLTRQAFPDTEIKMTTHGSYPFQPWLMDSGLDILRLSVDGATAASYERYRRGGRFEAVIQLMTDIRNHRRRTGSRLRVIWKYILFQWNDSDDEIRLAARLADELETDLLFVLTDTPGHSQRFTDAGSLRRVLDRLAPRARLADCLEHLLAEEVIDPLGHQKAEAAALLQEAQEALQRSRPQTAAEAIRRAITLDTGRPGPDPAPEQPLPKALVEHVAGQARAPSTLAGLANIALFLGQWADADRLFRRYLQIGPEAADRSKVEDLLVVLALRTHLGSDDPSTFFSQPPDRLRLAENAVLSIDPGHRPGGRPATSGDRAEDFVNDLVLPLTAKCLAYVCWAGGDSAKALALFQHYLEASPETHDVQAERWAIEQLQNQAVPA